MALTLTLTLTLTLMLKLKQAGIAAIQCQQIPGTAG
jgi:hypothetical protein